MLVFILLVFLWAFWIYGLVSLINFKLFLAIIASNISFGWFSLLICQTNSTPYQLISEFFDVSFYLFHYCFFVFPLRKFLLMCPQVDWFCVECTRSSLNENFISIALLLMFSFYFYFFPWVSIYLLQLSICFYMFYTFSFRIFNILITII